MRCRKKFYFFVGFFYITLFDIAILPDSGSCRQVVLKLKLSKVFLSQVLSETRENLDDRDLTQFFSVSLCTSVCHNSFQQS